MLFDGDGLTYRALKSMDMAEYYECIMYVMGSRMM